MSTTLHPELAAPPTGNTGVFAWLRRWIERRPHWSLSVPEAERDLRGSTARTSATDGQVLPFPVRGEALLVTMAEGLRRKVADRVWMQDPLILSLSRNPHSRLTIDRDAYVEFHPASSAYRAVLAVGGGTTMTVDTLDFDTVVKFVVLYVTDRLDDALPMEAVW